ncbi:MAG: hypothetical protein JO001_08350 [Alphaproteobacteria bacterium]|nr:hypothetical protein [Alphaproteobacteria bacterium]
MRVPNVVLVAISYGVIATVGLPAFAADTASPSPGAAAKSDTDRPAAAEGGAPAPGGGSGGSLSRELTHSNGVIKPPTEVDPALTRSPPSTGPQSTPVVPPMGGPGGPPNVIAK